MALTSLAETETPALCAHLSCSGACNAEILSVLSALHRARSASRSMLLQEVGRGRPQGPERKVTGGS